MAIQHRDSAILSTSGEIASAVRAVGQLHCEARQAYDEPADWLPYEDESRSVEGPGAGRGGPEGTAPVRSHGRGSHYSCPSPPSDSSMPALGPST
jgi:hypothetical protein